MAKLTVLGAALLVALFALAEATTYTTTVTSTTFNDGGSSEGSQEECQRHIQGQQLDQCTSYLFQGSQRPYRMRLRMMVADNRPVNQQEEQQKQLQQCCEQLRNIDSKCRCAAVGQVVRQQMQKEQQQGQQMQQVLQKAQNLPSDCNMQQPHQCQIQPIWF